MSAADELVQGCERVASDRNAFDVEGKFLLGKTPRGVVVLERHFRAGNDVVLRLDMQPRQRDRPPTGTLVTSAGADAAGACAEGGSACSGAAPSGVAASAL